MPLSLGLRLGLSASTSSFGWVPIAEGVSAAVAFDGQSFALPAYGSNVASGVATQSVTTVAGKLYELSAAGSGTITISVGTAAAGTNILAAATFATPRYFTAVGTTTHLTVTVTTGSLTALLVREVMLGELGTNLGASGYTMGTQGGTASATESPTGTLNLAGDGTFTGFGDKSFATIAGAHYRIIALSSNAQITCRIGTTQGNNNIAQLATAGSGVTTIEFTATGTTTWVRFDKITSGAATISSITIAQWTPRPTLRTAAFSEVFAFTGSSTTAKTYVGADGLIKNDLAADVPRWDYSNGKARLLLENASTNSALRSAEFDNATWTKLEGTITATNATAPDGTASADTFIPNTTGGVQHRLSQTFTATAASATLSVFVKPGGYTRVAIREHTITGFYSSFLLSGAGAVLENSSATGSITALANGWYRISMTYTATAASHGFGISVLPETYSTGSPVTETFAGDGIRGITVWGAQVELGQAFASSYIPTTSATVTRTIETARFSPLVEAIYTLPGTTTRVQGQTIVVGDGSNSRAILGLQSSELLIGTLTNTVGRLSSNGAFSTNTAGSGGFLTGYGAVTSFNSSGKAASLNGSTIASDTAAPNPRTEVYLARSNTISAARPYTDGYYASFALWPFRVSNANLPAIAVAPT